MPRSPQWMDLYQIWFRVSSHGRNQMCGILLQSAHGFRFCEGSKFAISQWLGRSPLTQCWRYTAQPVITNFGDFGGCKPTFLEWQRWNLAWGYERGTPSPALNCVKIAQGDLSLGGNFYKKLEIFPIFSYLSPYFYTDNVDIVYNGRLGIHQRHKISSESLKGPVGIALSRGGDAYWFLVEYNC